MIASILAVVAISVVLFTKGLMQIQKITNGRQVPYPLSHAPSPFVYFLFLRYSLTKFICPDLKDSVHAFKKIRIFLATFYDELVMSFINHFKLWLLNE
jgi:hypothetical protein